ncbi:MAG TPA: hypothetical protein VEG68_04485 [Terriglobales bacterium]|nr:hypothetical protein [Terriglobales bacterium]
MKQRTQQRSSCETKDNTSWATMTSVTRDLGDLLAVVGDSIIVAALALFGTLTIVNPKRFQSFYRSMYERYAVIRMWPFSGLALKPWYVVWLRVGGVLAWGFAAGGAYAIWLHLQH